MVNCIPLFADECPILDNPGPNGDVVTSGEVEGSTATYSCSDGYDLVGVSERVCGSDGVWNGTQPTCEREYDWPMGVCCLHKCIRMSICMPIYVL